MSRWQKIILIGVVILIFGFAVLTMLLSLVLKRRVQPLERAGNAPTLEAIPTSAPVADPS